MEPLFLFLETFINLTDRIINLKKSQLQNKQQVFREIIEPLFTELQLVVDNYLLLFRRTKQRVENSSTKGLRKAVQEVRKAREAMLLSRIKVREMANQITNEFDDKEIIEFARKVQGFFYRTEVLRFISISHGAELVDLLEYVAEQELDKSDLIEFIDKAIANMENSWIEIAQLYAKVRINCLSSPELIKKAAKRKQ